MLPFTEADFFAVFARYNQSLWPAPVAAYAVGVAVLLAALIGGRRASIAVGAGLALMWAVNGAGYHLWQFARINPAAYGFGAAFLLQAALLLGYGIGGRLRFGFENRAALWVGLALVLYAALVYPLLGAAGGHGWPRSPVFGLAPCPTTIFTLGILLLARPPLPWAVLAIPILWAAIGSTAAVLLSVPEDLGLLVAAVAAGAFALRANRRAKDLRAAPG